jgi:hypothetical protein
MPKTNGIFNATGAVNGQDQQSRVIVLGDCAGFWRDMAPPGG